MYFLYLQPNLPFPESSGNARCYEFARQWAAQGHRVVIIAGREGGAGAETREGVDIHWVDAGYHHQMGFLRRIFSWSMYLWGAFWVALRLPKPDLLLAYSPPLPTAWLAALLAARLRVPYCVEVADVWPDVPIGMGIIRSRWLGSVLRAVSGRVYRGARRVFAFSDDMIPLLTAYGVAEGRIQVVYNGVGGKQPEAESRKPKAGEAEGASPGLQLSAYRSHPSSIEILYAGTIGMANDLTQAVQAAALLQARGRTDLHFTFLGDGNDRNRVAALVQSLDLQNITFVPPVPYAEAMQRIARADIGLCCFAPFPVLESNGSSKFCDYLACGTPVVLNYRGWQGALVEAHACGLAVPQGDPAALADAIIALADNPALRAEMGLRGQALARERFDRTALAAEMLAELVS